MSYQPPQYEPPTSNGSYGRQQPYSPAPQQQYGQQPYAALPPGYPTPPPAKKRKWPWIVGGVLLASILGCIGLFTVVLGGTGAALNELDENSKGQHAVAGQMGAPATDGKFQFMVTAMKCGATSVGADLLGRKAQGQYCILDVQIKNVGDSVETVVDLPQKAYDAKGNEYSVDAEAGLYANAEQPTFLEQINPGNTVKGKLVFDVPPGTKLTSVVLHESSFTAGVKVPLK